MTLRKLFLTLSIATAIVLLYVVTQLGIAKIFASTTALIFIVGLYLLPLIHGFFACPKKMPLYWLLILFLFGWFAYPIFLWQLTAKPKNKDMSDGKTE